MVHNSTHLLSYRFCGSGGWGSLAGCPISGSLTRLSFRKQPGLGSHLQLDWRRISFPAHMVVHSSWRVIGLRSLTPCSPLARGHPQFLALWTSLYGSLLHQSQRGRQSIQRVCQQGKCYRLMQCHHGIEWHPTICCIPLVRNKPQPYLLLKGGDYTRVWTPEGVNHGSLLRVCLPHLSHPINRLGWGCALVTISVVSLVAGCSSRQDFYFVCALSSMACLLDTGVTPVRPLVLESRQVSTQQPLMASSLSSSPHNHCGPLTRNARNHYFPGLHRITPNQHSRENLISGSIKWGHFENIRIFLVPYF